MEEAVDRGWAAFSQSEARRRGVDWLDLVRSEAMNARLVALVERFEREGYRPDHLKSLVSADDARKRWAALAAFHKERGHFLDAQRPVSAQTLVGRQRDARSVPRSQLSTGRGLNDAYAVPRRGYITRVERDGDRVRLFGDIEVVQKYQRSYAVVRQPLQSIASDVLKRSVPECRYLVTDGEDRVVLAGQAQLAGDASFHVDLAGKLPAGRFTLAAQIIVNGNAMNAEIRRIPVGVPSRP